jgi:drug/metabolite transporter (DMT)-like permease
MRDCVDHGNRRGILAMAFAMASFVANDALVKFVSQSLPAAQLIFLRGVFALALLMAATQAMGLLRKPAEGRLGPVQLVLLKPVIVRSALDALATLVYLASLFHLPLGNATAINMATPLMITLFVVLVWREQVSPGRWVAILLGFIGVLMIVQPVTEGFNSWALLCLAGTALHAARDICTRSIPGNVPSILITLGTAISVTTLSGVLSLIQGWEPFSPFQLGLLAGASVFLSVGYYLLILSTRAGDMSVVAPFRYVGLLFALILGWAVWGDLPNALAWVGIVLLLGAGVYMLRRA